MESGLVWLQAGTMGGPDVLMFVDVCVHASLKAIESLGPGLILVDFCRLFLGLSNVKGLGPFPRYFHLEIM